MALAASPWRSALDARLALRGENVTLSRRVGAANATCECRAFVRLYLPEELAGSVIQGDSHVILSGTELGASDTWPGTVGPGDQLIPRTGDTIVVAGRTRNVEAAAPIYIAGVLVRIDMQVRG